MTRQELKEQVQHDQFTDAVSSALSYTASHRKQVVQWAVIGTVVVVAVLGILWYRSYQASIHQADLAIAMEVVDTPVASANADPAAKSFPTQDAKNQAAMKALSGVVAKDGGSRAALTARYYLGTLKAQTGDEHGAESDLSKVADSSSEVAPLAKIALAQLYAGQNKRSQAQDLLRGIINKPTDLVSKAQATVLLAHLDETSNPAETRKLLDSLKADKPDPAVTRAVEAMTAQLAQ